MIAAMEKETFDSILAAGGAWVGTPDDILTQAKDYQQQIGGFEIASLDGLRAFSILLVFLSHTELNGIVPGGFGVTVFFFLSGYLITTLLRWEAESRGSISLRNRWERSSICCRDAWSGAIGRRDRAELYQRRRSQSRRHDR